MGEQTIKLSESGWIYCFKQGSKFVFLDRKDKLIKSFDTYNEAITFANANINLINQNPIKKIKNA
jgi:hypothetical protein|tara:strand:+ start:401 stop:595 length:195 start_codon:yes stop_codon:yes gene_type:complete